MKYTEPPEGYKRVLNYTKHGYQVVSDPKPVRRGKTSQRFEVRDGDGCPTDPDANNWSDLDNDRARCELKGLPRKEGIYWYSWSMYIPEESEIVWPTKTTFFQFYETAYGPVFMLQEGRSGLWIDRQIDKVTFDYEKVINKVDFKGQWHDFVVSATWSPDYDGEITLWIDGELKYEYKGPTTHDYECVRVSYGVYQAYISRYKEKNEVDTIPTQIAYFDEIQHGTKKTDVNTS